MIGARLPQGVAPHHALASNQGVHQAELKTVSHVQGASDVRRGQHNGIRLALMTGLVITLRFPEIVPMLFNLCWLVCFFHRYMPLLDSFEKPAIVPYPLVVVSLCSDCIVRYDWQIIIH